MPQESIDKKGWDASPPRDWGEEQARRVALEIKRLRGRRSAQWLSNRTKDLGFEVTRSVISDLEIARRRYVTVSELIILARALDIAPIALLYPAPYRETIEILPVPDGGQPRQLEKIVAVQWFSGESGLHLEYLGLSLVDQMNYSSQLLALERARKAFVIDARKRELSAQLSTRRRAKRQGLADVTDEELDDLVTEISELEKRIDELWKLGGRDLHAEAHEAMFGSGDGG